MGTLILLACLTCVCDAHRLQQVEEDTESNTIMADGTTKAYGGTNMASWESKNFARYCAGELNDAELGLANLMDGVHDTLALSQMAQMMSDPESLAEMKKTMASPSFKAQATRALKRSAHVTGAAQEDSSKAGLRNWELENAASYTSGKSSLAEFGATNLLAAMHDPSVMAEAVQMLRKPDNVAAVKKMSFVKSFQQEAKRVAKEMDKLIPCVKGSCKARTTANQDAPQSLAQVSEAKAQDGVEASYSPLTKALALGLLASNPAAAFHPAAPVSRVVGPSRTASSMQAGGEPDTSMQADEELAPVARKFDVQDMAGVTAPLGFFDPLGFSKNEREERIRFYREVELKHGRVAMLAALGFLVAEQFHPLWGGGIDVPSYLAFQETPLQIFWPFVVAAIALPEIFSVQDFVSPLDASVLGWGGVKKGERFGPEGAGFQQWLIRKDHEPGDLGFDPLGLKPKNPEELKEMQNKELNNGRLAMIGMAGMVAQELATGSKLFS